MAASVADFLKQIGHDAVHLWEAGLCRLSDEEIVAKAIAAKRVILTHDLDFSRIIVASERAEPSLVTFRLTDMRPENVRVRLAICIDQFQQELEQGALISITDKRYRCRRLPLL